MVRRQAQKLLGWCARWQHFVGGGWALAGQVLCCCTAPSFCLNLIIKKNVIVWHQWGAVIQYLFFNKKNKKTFTLTNFITL